MSSGTKSNYHVLPPPVAIPCGWQALKIQEITAPGDWEWSAQSQQWVPVLVRACVCYGETRIRRMNFRVGETVRVFREPSTDKSKFLCEVVINKIFTSDSCGKQLLRCYRADESLSVADRALRITSDFLQPVIGFDRTLGRWKREDVLTATMHPQDNPNLVPYIATPGAEPTVKESLTVAVKPEPVSKEFLTTEEIANPCETVQQIVVVTDDSGDEALYLVGVLKAWDSTICACDIAAIAGDSVVTVSHTNAGQTLLDWPKKLSDVFASNSSGIPDSSNPSEAPNSSVEVCGASEPITIGCTIRNAYEANAEPITKPIQRKRVLYIAGPMRGIAWFNYPLFHRVARELREAGNKVISPADEDFEQDGFNPFATPAYHDGRNCTFPEHMDFEKVVRRCLDAVLRCDGMVLLPGWEKSPGALAELAIAAWMGKRVWAVDIDEQDRLTIKANFMENRSIAFSLSEAFWPNVVVSNETQKFISQIAKEHKDDEDILAEASRITRGNRQAQYGPPDQDFRRTAGMWSSLFAAKLKEGVTFEPRDVALAMILLKTSRETHQRKRDNWVDIAGYASCGSRCN